VLGGEPMTAETLLPVGVMLGAVVLIVAGKARRMKPAPVHLACEPGAS